METNPASEMSSTSASANPAIASSASISAFNADEGKSGDAQLNEGEIMRIELYEEVPRLNRELVIKEKIQIKKILTQESAAIQPE